MIKEPARVRVMTMVRNVYKVISRLMRMSSVSVRGEPCPWILKRLVLRVVD